MLNINSMNHKLWKKLISIGRIVPKRIHTDMMDFYRLPYRIQIDNPVKLWHQKTDNHPLYNKN